ncbi:MAG: ATP-binding protein [Candidatus Methanofastidiosia archaeon]|jgi:hypothetical protein
MDIIGITFDGEMEGYLIIKALKISKWIDPKDLSLDVVFRITINHTYKDEKLKKIKKLYVYFLDKDLENIIIDKEAMKQEQKRLKNSLSEKGKQYEVEKGISPLEGYIYPILTKRIMILNDGYRKRLEVDLSDYEITEETMKRNILFPLKFSESIFSYDSVKPIPPKIPWYYDCLIEPYLVQSMKWDENEFMPPIESLELWLQIPEDLYKSLSNVNVQPVGHFEQMFLLGEEMAKKFRDAGQPLAKGKTLCINWFFPNIDVSSSPEEIEVTCGLKQFKVEENFIKRFEENPERFILILRELLYKCRIQMLDFKIIEDNISDNNLKKVISVFNTMVFQRNLKSMKENLKTLLPLLDHYKNFSYGKEFYNRYDIFNALINCEKSEDFFSDEIESKFRQVHEFGSALVPEYEILVEDIKTLVELTEKFYLYDMVEDKVRYKNKILSKIDELDHKWIGKFTHPDKYILFDILTNWKHIIEKEYEEQAPRPEIKATIKTKHLALSEKMGIVFSINNIGKGEAHEIYIKLLQSNDYDIVSQKSETKTYLASKGRSFEPELLINPKKKKEVTILYEVYYEDVLGKKNKSQFEDTIEFIEEEIPFKKIENPYIIGDIVRDSRMFYGREKLLTDIVDNFKGRYQINPIFLYGQRRTGKTSTLVQLEKRLKDGFFPVLFSMREIFGRKSFYKDLMEKIKEKIGLMNIKIPDIEEDPFDIFKNEFYSEVQKKLGKKKMVIMIDEYQQIDELINHGYYDTDVIDFLNALVQDGEIKFIFAGSLYPHELKSNKWAELMKFFIQMNVSFLERDDAIKLITEPVRGQMKYDEGGIEKIISLSRCHPYFVQLICHTMVEHHNHDKVNLIGYENIINHLFEYFERGNNVFSDIMLTQTNELQQKILFVIYNLMKKKKRISVTKSDIEWNLMSNGKTIEKKEIEKSLSYLEKREIIQKSAERPENYEFVVDLYKYWVKWNISSE